MGRATTHDQGQGAGVGAMESKQDGTKIMVGKRSRNTALNNLNLSEISSLN